MKTSISYFSYVPVLLVSISAFLVFLSVPGSFILTSFGATLFGAVLFVRLLIAVFQPSGLQHPITGVIFAHLAPFWSLSALILLLVERDKGLASLSTFVGLLAVGLSLGIITRWSKEYLQHQPFLRATAWVSVVAVFLLLVMRTAINLG